MDDSPPPPEPSPPATAAPAPPPVHTGSPTDFLKGVVGKRVIVRLTSGVDYCGTCMGLTTRDRCTDSSCEGVLSCLDGYMNIALEQTEEHANGRITNRYGDAFIRGNNGAPALRCPSLVADEQTVLYISAAEAF